jgi:hypothetical protein
METLDDDIQRSVVQGTDKDRAAIEAAVDEALRFSSPRDNRIDRATYFRRSTEPGSPKEPRSTSGALPGNVRSRAAVGG